MYFPFDNVRPIQQKLVDDIFSAIKNGKHLIAHAPTGLGKTAAALSPALTIALEQGHSVFFLTPKHTQHQIAIETLQKIKQKHSLSFNVVDLIGKKWMCSQPAATETLSSKEFNQFCKDLVAQEQCPFFNAVWGKGSNKLQGKAAFALTALKHSDILHAEDFIKKFKDEFCAYELATLLGKESTVVIADYYHLFHPSVRAAFLGRLKKELQNSIIIVDEAHNLPGRIRAILSERLSQFAISRATKEAKAFHFDDLAMATVYLTDAFNKISKEFLGNRHESILKKEYLVEEIEKATGYKYDDLIGELDSSAAEVRKAERKSYLGSIADFLNAWNGEDMGFVRIAKRLYARDKKAFLITSYNCLNPSTSSASVFDNCASAVLMSGTLVPGELYRDLLGLRPERTEIKVYPSPFEVKNRLALIEPSSTTKFTERNPKEFEKIAKICAEIIKEVPHNTAIFFPSYLFLRSILSFAEEKIQKQIFVDRPEFNKQQRAEILSNFKSAADKGAVLFAVQGASFAEGIDLPGKFLEAVIVVGVPLAAPDLETQALIDYYDYKFKRGWDYGYIYPAMTKALQAAGRCIRQLEDRGCIVFLDKRYTWPNYLKCIPPDWRPIVTKLPAERIKKFFTGGANN